ncbi:MAG: hypothetical protein GY869_11335 [Planctomycetes bacterium]|nr:hypothetical protein [Planctomycetota bacterium]
MKKSTLILIVIFCNSLLLPALAQQVTNDQQRYQTIPPQKTFTPLHIYIDSGNAQLAAFQFELTTDAEKVYITGVENGEHPAFADTPPYYDPAALQKNRIIIANFNTTNDLPTGSTRVATIHLMIQGPQKPQYKLNLITAADQNGNPINARISLLQGDLK